MVRVFFPEGFEEWAWCTVGQGTTCFQVGQQHFFRGVEDLGCFGHKMHTRKNDDIGIGLAGLLCQSEAVANIIGHILDIGFLVIVCQDHCILLLFQPLILGK